MNSTSGNIMSNGIIQQNQVSRTYEDSLGDQQSFNGQPIYQNMTNIHVFNHKQQTFATAQLMQNSTRSLSIHDCPDQNDFEMQLLNANINNSSEMMPASKCFKINCQKGKKKFEI